MQKISTDQITGLILAGGQGMRMGKVNKGLQPFNGKPMILHVIDRLETQVGSLIINVNHDRDLYAQFGFTLLADTLPNYLGPLAGLHAGFTQCKTAFIATAPCDTPFLPRNLVEELRLTLQNSNAQIAVALSLEKGITCDEWHQQPLFCLARTSLRESLEKFLQGGGRKVKDWLATIEVVNVKFTECEAFRNINTLEELNGYATNSHHSN
ncbi:molybdenum cofactor guanylyltransferase MobA [Undibacterium fentianense]|uniref:Molybdenum cofactor guanylyltransferase n=1 Tax=Undibacterium fentianense TaxID=2828728 RepID=A0A941IFF5_9BURK|nr:molybdenum cofactor guanylyltransferase MobA [Undibacterium fentianense]MBR7798990.1 molybdenum cofactor guanylyltransferase [Undibacterium fentianense]